MQRMIDPNLTDMEKNQYLGDFIGVMNEISKIRRRMNWFSHEMSTNLEYLDLIAEHPYRIPNHRAEDRDFIIIHDKFLSYRKWSEKLLDITSAHLALMETEKSISDSKALSRLTILGSFFVPVSFDCSFFSMNGDFAVGETKFWVYFAVTLPLIVVILVIVFWEMVV
jgi:Mg2+ and Co2+ transporter CorA